MFTLKPRGHIQRIMYTRTHAEKARTHAKYFIIILAFLQSRVYKMKIFCIFLLKYLHISKKSSTFAVSNKKHSQ